MTSRKSSRKFWVFLMSLCLLAAYGCSHSSPPPPNPVAQSQPQSGGSPSTSTATGPRPQFLDFPDIPIPSELSLQPKESYVFQAGSTKTGVLTLRGRVDINSLINFFTMAMPRENWRPLGQFRYKRSVLFFGKPDKTCMIELNEGTIWTWVDIFVAPMPAG